MLCRDMNDLLNLFVVFVGQITRWTNLRYMIDGSVMLVTPPSLLFKSSKRAHKQLVILSEFKIVEDTLPKHISLPLKLPFTFVEEYAPVFQIHLFGYTHA